MKTLEQMRAENAWLIVKELINKAEQDGEKQKDQNDLYASYVSSLPANIITIGIGQSLASLLAASQGRKDDPHYLLYKHTQDWLCRDDTAAPYCTTKDHKKNLMDAIISSNQESYKLAQAETLAWLEWLKKFAVAYLKKPKNDREERG